MMLSSKVMRFKVKTAPKLSFGILGVHMWNPVLMGANYPQFSGTSIKTEDLWYHREGF